MTDAGAQVTTVGVLQSPGRLQVEHVVDVPLACEPEVPQPGIGQLEHGQPFTPEEAMLLMNERWNARKSARTGAVPGR